MTQRTRDGARTRTEIRQAAAELFYEHGYAATSLRAVADRVGIKVGSLYNHMGGKDELLTDIMTNVLDTLGPAVTDAAAAVGDDPVQRLRAAVGTHIRFHAQHAQETLIGNSELRSLQPAQRAVVLKERRRYEEMMSTFIAEAAEAAGVEVLDLRLQTYAVLALGMHIASWFRDDRRNVALEHVVDVYTEITCRQIGIT